MEILGESLRVPFHLLTQRYGFDPIQQSEIPIKHHYLAANYEDSTLDCLIGISCCVFFDMIGFRIRDSRSLRFEIRKIYSKYREFLISNLESRIIWRGI